MHALEIQGLAKDYAVGFWKKTSRTALSPLHLNITQGETFGFLGPNGAGKTTTLKLLMGIIFPTSGTATILGRDIGDPEVKRKVGFLPEQPYFYDYLSAPELLDYYARLSGVPASARKKRIAELLERVGLRDVGNKQLRKFSKGMLQRVGIAQAIIHDPEIVFLDEPMSGLDPVGRHDVRELIQQLKDQGYTGTQRSVYRYLETLKQAEVRATASPSRLQKFSATTAVWLGCRVTLRLLMTSNERIWPPFAKSAQPS